MRRFRRFVAFWYDFIVGDDWRAALAVIAALAVTYFVHRAGAPAWWIVPAAVALVLPVTVWRVARARRQS
ncbi:hypothetical protein LWP59_13280 [Amycolatopsis acidiphila]|nr:hypothetical protein [Amycolatopsis acidiphila]UIJ62528.1 hypothetical protein LWP59_13280 [Amycolatopsis acidiphila]GHG85221.1 hypothetical protein GCM10017788_57720 [Amycolatopsis acidiphila]